MITFIKMRRCFPAHFMLLQIIFLASLWAKSLHAQETPEEKAKPKIISKSDSLAAIKKGVDSTHAKIIFKTSGSASSHQIEVLSSKEFRFMGETRALGPKGENLKKAIGQDGQALAMIDKAYQKQSSGKVLVGVGVVIAVAGFLAPLQLAETSTTTYYWFPGVTVGAVIGGVGLKQQGELVKDLRAAVKMHNANPAKENQ
jgi:hypothetical protein